MKLVSKKTTELLEKVGQLTEDVVSAMIRKSSLEADMEFEAGPFRIKAVLASQKMIEEAMVEAYRDSRGEPLDMTTRELRLQRLILAAVVKEIEEEVTFEIGNEEDYQIKLMVFEKLPEILVTRIYTAYAAKRAALMLILARSGADSTKKSPASLSGEFTGNSSDVKEESPSPGTSSPT
jgi:hypothetical protein